MRVVIIYDVYRCLNPLPRNSTLIIAIFIVLLLNVKMVKG
jgi:hypothetical protein